MTTFFFFFITFFFCLYVNASLYFFTALPKFWIPVTFVAAWTMQEVNQMTVIVIDDDDELCAECCCSSYWVGSRRIIGDDGWGDVLPQTDVLLLWDSTAVIRTGGNDSASRGISEQEMFLGKGFSNGFDMRLESTEHMEHTSISRSSTALAVSAFVMVYIWINHFMFKFKNDDE